MLLLLNEHLVCGLQDIIRDGVCVESSYLSYASSQ